MWPTLSCHAIALATGGCSIKITEDVPEPEQGITEEAAIEEGLKQKATEFTKSGAEIYVKG